MFQNVKEKCSKFFDLLPENRKLIWIFILVSAVFLVILLEVHGMFVYRNDVYLYFEYATNIFDGQMPYSDFVFEYPPFTIPFIAFPRLFTSDLQTYCVIFSIMALVCFLVGTVFLLKIAKLFDSTNIRILVFAALTLFMTNIFLFARNDIFPVVICIIGIYFYLQKKYDYAWITIAIGAMTKLFPIFFIPVFLIPLLIKKDYCNAIRGILLPLVVAVIISLPFLISDISTAFDYLSYHTDRGIQIESVVSSIMLFANIFSPGLAHVSFSYASHNIEGSLPDAVEPFMIYLLVAAVLLFILWLFIALYRKRESMEHEDMKKIIIFAGIISVMVFLTFNKVFSAQFVIWVLMLTAITQIGLFGMEQRNRILIIAIIYAAISFFCGAFYQEIVELNSTMVTLLFVRNMLHIVFTGYLIYLLVQTMNQLSPNDKGVGVRALLRDFKQKISGSR